MTNIRKMAYLFPGSVLLLNQYSCNKQETFSEPAGEVLILEAVESISASERSEALIDICSRSTVVEGVTL
jgi:hypothetical protein